MLTRRRGSAWLDGGRRRWLRRRRVPARLADGQGERGVLRQHRALELAQALARLDAELLDQPAAGVLVGLERLGLAVGAVEREHQLRAQVLPERVLLDQGLERRDHLGVAAERELRLDLELLGAGAQVRQARGFGLRERLVGEIRERLAAPESQPLLEPRGGPLGPARGVLGARLAEQALEAVGVDALGVDLELIAALARDQQLRAAGQSLAQTRDVHLDGLGRGLGRRRRPRRPRSAGRC